MGQSMARSLCKQANDVYIHCFGGDSRGVCCISSGLSLSLPARPPCTTADHYIAYCGAGNYADYEHGAFWFDLEPSARAFAKMADVLFIGDSRLQVGFSTAATANWFSAASTRYYLLGFAYWENMVFAEGLLRRIQPKARVYVINVDGFFERSETPPVKTILHDPEARHRYESEAPLATSSRTGLPKPFQILQAEPVTHLFRSRETGAYTKPV